MKPSVWTVSLLVLTILAIVLPDKSVSKSTLSFSCDSGPAQGSGDIAVKKIDKTGYSLLLGHWRGGGGGEDMQQV